MARIGRTAVTRSDCQRFSQASPPRNDARPFVDVLVDACLWAGDWLFLHAPERLEVGPLLVYAARLFPRAEDRRELFWDKPRRWHGF